MRWAIATLIVSGSLGACVQLGSPRDPEAGASDDGAAAASGAGGATSRVSGTQCGTDPSSGIALCLGISSCPGVHVDPDQFPECGYRIMGSAIDLECLCGDALCPLGAAASCLDARALLSEQSAQGVCAGIAEGRCTTLSETSNRASPSCDQQCRAQCSGVPGCLTLCGC